MPLSPGAIYWIVCRQGVGGALVYCMCTACVTSFVELSTRGTYYGIPQPWMVSRCTAPNHPLPTPHCLLPNTFKSPKQPPPLSVPTCSSPASAHLLQFEQHTLQQHHIPPKLVIISCSLSILHSNLDATVPAPTLLCLRFLCLRLLRSTDANHLRNTPRFLQLVSGDVGVLTLGNSRAQLTCGEVEGASICAGGLGVVQGESWV